MDFSEKRVRRFWAKVKKHDGGCWEWTGSLSRGGYGMFGADVTQYSHRYSYTLARGPIPDGADLDHLCRNRACCNPDHLEAVTRRENLLRGETIPARKAAQTHCIHGHEFTPENTFINSPSGTRACRTCRKAATDRWRAEHRELIRERDRGYYKKRAQTEHQGSD